MRFSYLILLACIAYGFYDWKGRAILREELSALAPKTKSAPAATITTPSGMIISEKTARDYYNPNGSIKTRQGPNGIIFVSEQESQMISGWIDQKFRSRDYTDIRLSDGTIIPLSFTPTGGTCPRTGLPNMNVSIRTPIAVPR